MVLRANASSFFVLTSLIAGVALTLPSVGCGSSSNGSGGGSGGGGGTSSGSSLDGGGLSNSDPTGGEDSGVVTFDMGDGASSGDAGSCAQINIGILGEPGANSSSNFQAWLVSSGTSVARIQTTTTDVLTASELAPFDVVILDQLQRDYTTQEAATFAAWVQAGGGVASMSGYTDDPTTDFRANALLAPLGVAYVAPELSGPVTQFATHPITAGLTSVSFYGGYVVADLGTAGMRTPLGFLVDGSDGGTDAVSMALTSGQGRGFVWGDEWIQFDSEWSSIPQIKQLWVQVFGWIAPTKCALVPPK